LCRQWIQSIKNFHAIQEATAGGKGGGGLTIILKSLEFTKKLWSSDGNSSDVLPYIQETKGDDVLNYKKKLNKVKNGYMKREKWNYVHFCIQQPCVVQKN
jgi:hypothetical protein